MLDPAILPDIPPKVDIRTHIYRPLPKTRDSIAWAAIDNNNNNDPGIIAQDAVRALAAALDARDSHALAECFLPDDHDDDHDGGAHWRDSLALTAHLRTFSGRTRIVPALGGLATKRGFGRVQFKEGQGVAVVREAKDAKWIEQTFTFYTESPALAECGGKVMLLPDTTTTTTTSSSSSSSSESPVKWRIWCLVTWLVAWDSFRQDERLLRVPSQPIPDSPHISTDVVIVGAGNSGLILAARLKALNVDFIVVEKNANVGDNWALRYDYLKFHTGRGWAEMPYLRKSTYHKSVTSPTKTDLVCQLHRFANAFDLGTRVLTRSRVLSTTHSPSHHASSHSCRRRRRPTWTLTILDGTTRTTRTITTSALVLATAPGFASTTTIPPPLPDSHKFPGPVIHSDAFKNAKETLIAHKGSSGGAVKSVIVVGFANTAFDVLEDCHNAGLAATMVQRSPTYIIPMGHLLHPRGLGMYDLMAEDDKDVGDVVVFGTPLHVGGPMLAGVHQELDALEPGKYDAVKKAGLQVLDSTSSDLLDVLLNRCGGHLVDMATGGLSLIANGTVPVHSGVFPTRYASSGMVLSNGESLAADAIVWCTGFGTRDGRRLLPDILGAGAEEIAKKMEPTWGVDAEGEVRGLWRRSEGVEGLWVIAGGGANHRWHSKVIALQIKGLLEGVLPEAYRGMPAEPYEDRV